MNIRGYICHFNRRNSNGEIVTADSFTDCLAYYKEHEIKIPINYNHQSDMIIGHIETVYTASDGLFVDAVLNEDVDTVRNFVLPLIKDGTLDRFSTEGYIMKDQIERIDKNTYLAKKFDLRAVAIVNLPADIEAKFVFNSANPDYSVFNSYDENKPLKQPENSLNRAYYIV